MAKYRKSKIVKFGNSEQEVLSERKLHPEPSGGSLTYELGMIRLEIDSYWFGAIHIRCRSRQLKVSTPMEGWLLKYDTKNIILVSTSGKQSEKIILVYTGFLDIKKAELCGWRGDNLVGLSVENFDIEPLGRAEQTIEDMTRPFKEMDDSRFIGGEDTKGEGKKYILNKLRDSAVEMNLSEESRGEKLKPIKDRGEELQENEYGQLGENKHLDLGGLNSNIGDAPGGGGRG